jgi:hypothetical protein
MTTVPGTDWIEYFDQNHQRKYYYHPITKETIWKLPKDAKKATKKVLENLEPGETLDLTPKYKDNVQPPKIPISPRGDEHFSPRKISGLKEILSPRGDKTKTNETKEEIKNLEGFSVNIPNQKITTIHVESPAPEDETKQRRKSRKEKLMSDDLTLDAPETEKDGWLELTQEGTQKKYYYNVKSKRTTWMKPSGPQAKATKDLLDSETSELKKKRSQSALMGSSGVDDFIPMKLLSPRSDGGSLEGLNGEIVSVDGETQPRRNSESVYTEAKKIHFYNEQGKSFAYDTSLQDILSNVDLTFMEVLNVSGNYSLKEYAKNNFRKQKEKVFIFKRDMTPEAIVTWQKGTLKTTLHTFKEEKDEKAALKLYQSLFLFF